MLFNKQVVILCVISIALVTADNIGDDCQLESGKTKGQCVLLKDCPEAIKSIKHAVQPQICSFKGIEPVVCCEKTQKPVSGEISRQKCAEYGESVYTMELPRILPLNPKPIKVDTCASQENSLIIRGTQAFPREFPHMALIGSDDFYGKENEIDWVCSGTLISDQFVLTAAHCLYSRDLNLPRWIRLGEFNISTDTDDAQPEDFEISETFIHPDYRRPSLHDDIALIKLDRRVKFNRFVRPACLHTSTDIEAPTYIATGWDNWKIGADRHNVLQRVILDKVSEEKCNKTFGGEMKICAGTNGKEHCLDDSGGPLQIYNKDVYCMYSVVGVASFGRPCGDSSIPGIYTKVSEYIDWIEKNVWP